MSRIITSEDADGVCDVSNGLSTISAIADCLYCALDMESDDSDALNERMNAGRKTALALMEMADGFQEKLSGIYNGAILPHVLRAMDLSAVVDPIFSALDAARSARAAYDKAMAPIGAFSRENPKFSAGFSFLAQADGESENVSTIQHLIDWLDRQGPAHAVACKRTFAEAATGVLGIDEPAVADAEPEALAAWEVERAAVITAFKAAHREYVFAREDAEMHHFEEAVDAAYDVLDAADDGVLGTIPTTPAGGAALLKFCIEAFERGHAQHDIIPALKNALGALEDSSSASMFRAPVAFVGEAAPSPTPRANACDCGGEAAKESIATPIERLIVAHRDATRAFKAVFDSEEGVLEQADREDRRYQLWEEAHTASFGAMAQALRDLCAAPASDLAEARKKAEYLLTVGDDMTGPREFVALLNSFLADRGGE